MKLISIAVGEDDEMYALGDNGSIYQRIWITRLNRDSSGPVWSKMEDAEFLGEDNGRGIYENQESQKENSQEK